MKVINKPVVKNVLLGTLVIIIGGLCSAMGMWDPKADKYFFGKLIALILICIIYIILTAYYVTQEVNTNKILRILQQQNKTFEDSMVGLISICEQSSKNVNKVIHKIIDEGKYKLDIWNFDAACRLICERVYQLLCGLHENSKDFGVSYIRRKEDDDQNIIYMNAYFNHSMSEPSIHGKERKISETLPYHDVTLFKLNKSDIEIIIGSENIDEIFQYDTQDGRKRNKGKYKQYVAIPVICSRDKGGKMVGLLEIVCTENTEIAQTEKEIREIVSKYLVPYAYLLLLLHKMEKALIAKPANNGENNEE